MGWFDISFNDLIRLRKHIKEIGEITDLYFNIQKDYYKAFGDKEELEKFNSRLASEEIEYDIADVKDLIKSIYVKTDNNDIQFTIQKHKFWD